MSIKIVIDAGHGGEGLIQKNNRVTINNNKYNVLKVLIKKYLFLYKRKENDI